MAEMICELEGSRGRVLCLYDTKIVIKTKKTVGSLLTGNITDGEKTIYLCDIVGVQHKKSGLLIGYLQFEIPSMQMNNKNDNFFSENTFTYESGKNGITNELMEAIYKYVTDRIEEIKYGVRIIDTTANFEAMKVYTNATINSDTNGTIFTNDGEVNKKKRVCTVGRDIPEGKHIVVATNPNGGVVHIIASNGELLDRFYVKRKEKIKVTNGSLVKLYNCEIEGYSFNTKD